MRTLVALSLAAACSSRDSPSRPLDDAEKGPLSDAEIVPEGWVKIQSAPPSAGPEFDRLAKEAADASERGDHKTALAKAESALAIDPARMAPLSVATTSACRLQDAAKANQYAKRLKGMWIDVAKDLCAEAGMKLDLPGFLPDAGP